MAAGAGVGIGLGYATSKIDIFDSVLSGEASGEPTSLEEMHEELDEIWDEFN